LAKALKKIDPYSTHGQRWVRLWGDGDELTRALLELWNKFGPQRFRIESARVQNTLFAPYKTKADSGAPQEWDDQTLGYLWLGLEIEIRLIRIKSKKPKMGIKPAIQAVFRTQKKLAVPWRPDLILDNAETARRLFYEAKNKLKKNSEAARMFNEIAELEVAHRLREAVREWAR
jgi:hypothetical protein